MYCTPTVTRLDLYRSACEPQVLGAPAMRAAAATLAEHPPLVRHDAVVGVDAAEDLVPQGGGGRQGFLCLDTGWRWNIEHSKHL